MKDLFYTAPDGVKIAYQVAGEGEPLLCLHGSGESMGLWQRTGWVDELARHYTVITPDLRGFGNSTVCHTQEEYALDCILGDLSGVATACGAKSFRVFAHSYGATVTFQAVRAGLPIVRAVCASGSMGADFFQKLCPEEHAEYEMLAKAKRNGTLARMTQYSPEEIAFIESQDMEKFSAMFGAWSKWQPVTPAELCGKVSVYSGSKDFNAEMLENTTNKSEELRAAGVNNICFEELDHDGLISERERCADWVLAQLV